VTFRDGGPDDIDAVLAVDRDAFPDTPTTRSAMEQILGRGDRVLLAVVKGEVAGISLYRNDDADGGYLTTLGVREAYRGRGIGAALTLRTAKRVFAEGAARLDLRTNDDNGVAIALYRKLGFRHVAAGKDYRRPADPRVIEAMRKQGEGTFIKFGGWR
jgi:ribosomal-protein-alanine N-acetyltransferase